MSNNGLGTWREAGLLLLLGILWGIPYALTKLALSSIPPITMVAARVTLAALVLWLVVVFRRKVAYDWRQYIGSLFFQGAVSCAIPYTLIALGQQTVDSALAAVLNSTTPLFVCLIGVVWLRQDAPSAERWVGVALGLGGVVIVAGSSALLGLGHTIGGQLAICVGTFSSAVGAIYGRNFSATAPEVTAAGALTSAAFILVPLCFFVENPLSVSPSAMSLMALAVNGILATALGFVVYFRLIGTLGSAGVASVGYLKPCFGVLVGWMFMAEPVTWNVLAGLAAILIGVAMINRKPESAAGHSHAHGTALIQASPRET
jgi:drug/metabolite transporter (DMT)-like permease